MYLGYFGAKGRDPSGLVVILVHGVNTDAAWYKRAISGLHSYWFYNSLKYQEIIEFTWGDECANGGFKRWQGGYPNYATDSVKGISSTTPNREYMVDASKRLLHILRELNKEKTSVSSKEPIDVIAHSQGTILTLAALHSGGTIDNFIMQGSPLDVWNKGLIKNNDLEKAKSNIRGSTYNYWSANDEWAYQKGGIGAHGDSLTKESTLSWITNREFKVGAVLNGYTLPGTGDYFGDFYDHPDYMMSDAFFEKIHGKDLSFAADIKISENKKLISEVKKWAEW